MKKLFVFLLLGLFMISFASAFNWGDGMVSYYKLDEASGTVLDATPNNLNGINYLATPNVAGKINTAYSFNKSNSNYANITANAKLRPDNLTYNVWFKTVCSYNVGGAGEYLVNFHSNSTTYGYFGGLRLGYNSTGGNSCSTLFTSFYNSTGSEINVIGTSQNNNDDNWHMATITFNGTNLSLYKDGVLENSKAVPLTSIHWTTQDLSIGRLVGQAEKYYFNGTLDEIGIWNRSLTGAEIVELYNSGSGLAYGGAGLSIVTLSSPANGTSISDIGTNFTVTGDVSASYNTTNITYYIWSNTTLYNKTTIALPSQRTINSTLFIDDFIIGSYTWNAEVCYGNPTYNNCSFAPANYTFEVTVFKQGAILYSSSVPEGASNYFSSIISMFPGNTLTKAIFEYNGTNYTTSLSFSGGKYNISSSIVAKVVDLDTNFTFRFYYYINGVYLPSPAYTQTIQNSLFGICGGVSNDSLLNLFLVDEVTKLPLTGDIEFNMNVVSMSSNEVVETLNSVKKGVNNVSICFTPPSVYEYYYLNAEIRYSSVGYASEFYFIQNADLINYPANLTLFDLNLTSSTEFLIKYQDKTLTTVEGAVIQLLRRYISEDVYEVVEAPQTSSIGTAIVHIDLNTNIYRAVVSKNGVVLDIFNNLVFDCENELSGQCVQNLFGKIDSQNSVPVVTLIDFAYSIYGYNNTITTTFSIPSGTPAEINILLIQKDTFGNTYLCNQTITSSSGSIDCSYNDTIGDSVINLYISKNGVLQAQQSFFIAESGTMDWLGNNFIIVFILLLSLVGMAMASPEWMIINAVITMVLAGGIWLLSGLNFVVGLGSLMWLVISAVILIMKISKQEDR